MVTCKGKKPITEIAKGEKIKIDGKEYEVDAHYVMIDHGQTKEMAIELFDPKHEEEDYQLRYFDDQVEESIRFFTLKAILYEEIEIKKIEW